MSADFGAGALKSYFTLASAAALVGVVRHIKTTPTILALLAVIGLATAPRNAYAADPPYTFKVIATIGSAAPGGGAFVNDFEPGRLNNHGHLAFTAEPELPFQEAIFLAGGGTLQQTMWFGQNAPGGGLFSTSELGVIGLNDAGDLAFSFTLEPFNFGPPIYGGTYRWSHLTQTLSPIVISGVTPVPGQPGSVFAGVDFDVQLNNLGTVVFNGFLNTPAGPAPGIFQQDKSGHLTSLVLPGDPAPGGGTFDFLHDTGLNDGGDVAFEGAVGGATRKSICGDSARGRLRLCLSRLARSSHSLR